jgi:hypothetical protein
MGLMLVGTYRNRACLPTPRVADMPDDPAYQNIGPLHQAGGTRQEMIVPGNGRSRVGQRPDSAG